MAKGCALSVSYLPMVLLEINLVNVYAETYPTEKEIFFRSLRKYFFPNARLILAGDLGGSVSIDIRLTDLKSVSFLCNACPISR